MVITQNGALKKDDNDLPVMGGTSSADNATIINSSFDPVTRRLLTSASGGSGTVTSVSVVTANGFAGSVATATTTPAITLSTTVTGVLVGNGTAISAAVSGTDLKTINGTSIIGSGNIVTPQGTVTSVSGTTDRVTSTGGATPVIDIAATYVGQTSITTLGTIGAGTWNATVIADGKIASALTGKTYNGLTITSTTGTLTVTNGKTLSVSNSGTLAGGDAFVLAIAAGKTLTVSNSVTLAGTDSTVMTFPTTSATIARTDAGQTFTGVQVFTSPSITTATLNGTNILADAAQISLTVPSADATATGFVTSAFNSGYSSTAVGDLVYLDGSATWQKTDADSTTTAYGLLGVALTVAASGAAVKVALPGSFVRLNAWNWTVGNTLYVGETAGAMQNTIPVGTDNVIRVVGFAVNADYIYFYPSQDVQTTVA